MPLGCENNECLCEFTIAVILHFTIYLHAAGLFLQVLWPLLTVKLPQLEPAINGKDGTWCHKGQCCQLFLRPNIARWSRKHSEKGWCTGRTLFAERECLKCWKLCTFNLPPWKVNDLIIVLFALDIFNLYLTILMPLLLIFSIQYPVSVFWYQCVAMTCRLLADF